MLFLLVSILPIVFIVFIREGHHRKASDEFCLFVCLFFELFMSVYMYLFIYLFIIFIYLFTCPVVLGI